MVMSFVLSFFPRGVLDEILNLIDSVSEEFPSYSFILTKILYCPAHIFKNVALMHLFWSALPVAE